MKIHRIAILAVAGLAISVGGQRTVRAQQKISNFDRAQVGEMLSTIHEAVKKNYYDPKFHGVDIDARYKQYKEALQGAQTLGEAFRVVAAYLSGLHDSHTYFVPPAISFRFDYGFRMQLIGDQSYIVEVRPGSDAASKIHPGDQIVKLGRYDVNRQDFSDLSYFLYQLAPQGGIALDLRDPSGKERQELVKTKFIQGQRMLDLTMQHSQEDIWNLVLQEEEQEHLLRERWYEIGDVMIWKMPDFDMDDGTINDMFGRARKHKTLILDLRGNPGGSVDVLEKAVGYVMDHNVTIATRVSRKPESR